jgi:uncharacterized protein (DUF58 family)
VSRGAAAALAGLVLILAALTFEAQPLFVPGVAFIIIGVITPRWVWLATRGASLDRRLQARRVIEDEPLEATVTVTRGAFGLPRAEIADPLADHPVPLGRRLAPITGRRATSLRLQARFSRRGRVKLPPPSLLVSDALDLATGVCQGTGSDGEVLVLPRTERVRWISTALGDRLDQPRTRALLEPVAATEVDGLRPYRPGTPASRIHWPAVARGAGLLERRLLADADSRPLVVLDARCDRGPEELDAAVRAAASLALELARRGGCGLLLPGRRRSLQIDADLAAWPAAHAQLAVVEGGPTTRPPTLAPGAIAGDVFYVAAAPLRRAPATLFSAPRGLVAVVLPESLTTGISRAPSFEVAGCSGFVFRAGHASPVRRTSARLVA